MPISPLLQGEVEEEPEVDLSEFLARQKLEDIPQTNLKEDSDDDVDTSLAHLSSNPTAASRSRKGNIQQIEWDEGLEEIKREKEIADANRGM